MRKQILNMVLTVFMLLILSPVCALAANTGDEIQITEQGAVGIVSGHAAAEGISSLRLSLMVMPAEEGAKVSFAFAEGLKAKITEYRYHEETGYLNLYLSGNAGLFEGTDPADPLTLGSLVVQDENGKTVEALVSVAADSLQYVYGTESIAEPAEVPQAPVTVKGSQTPDTPEDPDDPDDPDTPKDPDDSNKPDTPDNPGDGENGGDASEEDYEKLKETLENASTYPAAEYTPESYAALKAAMEEAEGILNRQDASAKELGEVLWKLQNAIGALVLTNQNTGNGGSTGSGSDSGGSGAGSSASGGSASGGAASGVSGANSTGSGIQGILSGLVSGSRPGSQEGENGSGTVASANTGDDTPVLPLVLLLLAGAAGLALCLAGRVRRR